MSDRNQASRLAICGGTPAARFDDLAGRDLLQEETLLLQVLRSGVWGGYSGAVGEFESRFGDYIGAAQCIATANGTVSLEVALRCEGIGPGDEVIVPPYTFMATASAVLQVGALPVFADIDRDTLNIDAKRFELAITDRTRAVIPVHFGGHPTDMDPIIDSARRHGIAVIEDAAHGHGGEYKGKRLGGIGEWGSFSFQQSKIMTSGEGGCLVANDDRRAAAARAYCNQGRIAGGAWYDHHTLGTNLRLTGFQAAVLIAQLDRLDAQTISRNDNAAILRNAMLGMPGVQPLCPAAYCTRHALALFLFRFDSRAVGVTKLAFEAALKAEGVPVMETYPRPLYGNPVFETWKFRNTGCPIAEASCREIVTLPFSLLNGGPTAVQQTVAAVEKVLQNLDELRSLNETAGAVR
jgi:dTDP-4-amino-4,6-dideoxygalactose transaminase